MIHLFLFPCFVNWGIVMHVSNVSKNNRTKSKLKTSFLKTKLKRTNSNNHKNEKRNRNKPKQTKSSDDEDRKTQYGTQTMKCERESTQIIKDKGHHKT